MHNETKQRSADFSQRNRSKRERERQERGILKTENDKENSQWLSFEPEALGILDGNQELLFQNRFALIGRQHQLVEARVSHRQPAERERDSMLTSYSFCYYK